LECALKTRRCYRLRGLESNNETAYKDHATARKWQSLAGRKRLKQQLAPVFEKMVPEEDQATEV